MTNKSIKIRLKELLQDCDMSQAELARRAGIREAVVSQMVNNCYQRIDLSLLAKVYTELNLTSFDQILEVVELNETEDEEKS